MTSPQPRVRVAPLQAHCFAFGGFEIQMLSALSAAAAAGVKIGKLDPWSRNADFEILHVWGLETANVMNVHWARQAGKQVVMTALLPYLGWHSRLRAHLFILSRFKAFVTGQIPVWRELLNGVDRLVVVNELQADTAVTLFKFPSKRIVVIPNIVDERFFPDSVTEDFAGGYVLCCGNICRRKNQLSLVHACRLAGLPLLLIGSVLTGEEAYGEEVRQAISGDPQMRWIQGVEHESDELLKAYRQAAVFALVSFTETQPISLLEAKATGCPLVVANRLYARQEYYRNAVLVEPESVASIAAGLTRAASGGRLSPDRSIQKTCSRSAVGRAYAELYRSLHLSRDKGPEGL